jgi:hypothetical protein
MSKGNTFENDLMRLVFNGEPIASLADNAAASPLTAFYLSLHTASPGESGTQATNEASYSGYSRVAVNRSVSGWTVTGNTVTNADEILFGLCTSGSDTLTHFAVGTASAGAGKILYVGTLFGLVAVGVGVRPEFGPGAITISED